MGHMLYMQKAWFTGLALLVLGTPSLKHYWVVPLNQPPIHTKKGQNGALESYFHRFVVNEGVK